MKSRRLQLFILALIIFILSGPFFIYSVLKLSSVEVKTQNSGEGVEEKEKRPDFSLASWLKRDFQGGLEKWFSQNFPLRRIYVRLNNQIYYSVFRKSYVNNQLLIIGKGRELYELPYILDYCNIAPPVEQEEIESDAKLMKRAAELFARRGKVFLVLITPSKASIYPEYIPEIFLKQKTNARRNYDFLISSFEKYKVPYVDGHAITLRERGHSQYPLFCRGGIHWNQLGAYFTAKEITQKAGLLMGRNIPFPEYSAIIIKRPKGRDKDLASLLNVFFIPDNYISPSPVLSQISGIPKLNASFIGESFTWILLDVFQSAKIFSRLDFHFYYILQHVSYTPEGRSEERAIQSGKLMSEISKNDLIVLVVNESYPPRQYIREFLKDAIAYLER